MRSYLSLETDKIVQLLNYFASKSKDKTISKEKALALIYFADRYHLRKYSRTITGDKYFATKEGPIPQKTEQIIDYILNKKEK